VSARRHILPARWIEIGANAVIVVGLIVSTFLVVTQ
jgi:hypothetical protein